MYEPVWTFSAGLVILVVAVVVSGLVARGRGYSGWMYGLLAVFLGVGAIPLTVLATRDRVDQEDGLACPGFNPVSPGAHLTPASASADLVAWNRLYRAIRNALLLGSVMSIAGILCAAALVVSYVLPTFVALFEGMSLALPMPTQILIYLTKSWRNPLWMPLWYSLQFSWPPLLYLGLLRAGYWFPLLGGVWRQADRLWAIQAAHTAGPAWQRLLPAESLRRLEAIATPELPETEPEFQALLRRERDHFSATLWSLAPALMPLMGLGLMLLSCAGASVFLPLYQLIGNVGG